MSKNAFFNVERALPPAVAVLCLAVGLANLGGWLAGATLFISVAPGLPAMVPVTTVLSLLTALGLWLQWRGRPQPAMLCCCSVVLLCAAIAACHLAGTAPPPFVLSGGGPPTAAWLSSPLTTAMFSVLGLALLVTGRGRWLHAAQGTALAVFLLALLNLTGYLFRDTFLYQFLPGRGTSILTTLQVMALSLGTLFARPRQGLMAAVTGNLGSARMSRRLLLSAFVLPIVLAGAVVAAARAGLYDAGTALPLFVWSMVVAFMVIIWRFALRLAVVDAARSHARGELHTALASLRAEQEHKDIFLATLAHELRNPLAPISAAAEVLRHGGAALPEERRRIGAVVAAQVGQITGLVDDLLDMERISQGRIALDKALLDLRTPMADAIEQVRPLMERKGHQCSVALADVPVHVCGDRKRLVQILSNLLNNAAKYTPPGGTVRVDMAVLPGYAEVIIEDNGIGIGIELQQRIFEPYAQAALTSDRTEGGLGLGLALARRLTGLHGGTLRVASAGAGQGSTFTVRLPLAAPAG